MKNAILSILILFSTLTSAQKFYFPPLAGNEWKRLSPDSLGWQPDSLARLHDFLLNRNTKSFMILKSGKIVVEWYFDDFTADKFWYWASAGKTLTAFLIGQAQDEGLLNINDRTSDYLGSGWTSAPQDKENLITIRHQLTMTTGLDDGNSSNTCTLDSCLHYLADAGERWAYHNAPYTLLLDVLEKVSHMSKNRTIQTHLLSRIGMNGLWIKVGDNQIFTSTTRSMARFGLLVQNRGVWDADTLLHDWEYFNAMTHSSQMLNKSYGYLWWLNGQGSYMLPGSQLVFHDDLIPSAPDDLIAALGKNDQRLYISNSLGLTVVRLGDAAAQSNQALSSFDNDLWQKIITLADDGSRVNVNNGQSRQPAALELAPNWPNPFNAGTMIQFTLQHDAPVLVQIYTLRGELTATLADAFFPAGTHRFPFQANRLPSGIYIIRLCSNKRMVSRKMLLLD